MTDRNFRIWVWIAVAIFCAIFVCLTPRANADTHYVKIGGNDALNGLSWTNAWATVNKVNTSITRGDTVYFGTGTWYGYPILPPAGTSAVMTVYSCSLHTVANKFKPKIRSGDLITNWIQHSGNVYKARWVASGGYSGGYTADACQTLVQVEADEMLVSVGSLANINQVGEFYYNSSSDTIYAWAWGGGDPDQYTLYASVKPVVWFKSNTRNYEFFGLDLQGGKQGVVLWADGINTDNTQFIHCHVAKSGHVNHENPTGFFTVANYGIVMQDSILIRACSLGYAIQENTSGWSDATGHGGSTDFYSTSRSVVESCYVYSYSANGICFKYTNEGIIIRYNYIDGTYAKKGITLYRDYCNAEVYGNILINGFSSVAMDIGAKDDGDTYGGHNVKIYNNTIVNYDELGIMLGNFDWESPVIFSGDCQVKYNLFWGYSHNGANGEYPCMDMGYQGWCTACDEVVVIDSNAYYSSTDAFLGACNGNYNYTWTQWKASCGEDGRGRNYNYQMNPSTYTLPDTTSLTMNRNYGGRTWTVWGAVQEPPEPDVTPPVISGLRDSLVASTSARIMWDTDETTPADTLEYGLTLSFGTKIFAVGGANHSVNITGLIPSTEYFYRARSYDAVNLGDTSNVNSLTTQGADTTPPTISAVTVTGITSTSAAVNWSTNEITAADTVDYGTSTVYSAKKVGTTGISHTANLTALGPGTPYHFRIRSLDAAGNADTTSDSTFTTSSGPDVTAPVITNINAEFVSANSFNVTWTTNELSESKVRYAPRPTNLANPAWDNVDVVEHSITLSGLIEDTTYYYNPRSRDVAGNIGVGDTLTFVTGADVIPPAIINLSSTLVDSTSARILWETDKACVADTVDYGTTLSLTSKQPGFGITDHIADLVDLDNLTKYYFRVRSYDVSDLADTSGIDSLTTKSIDVYYVAKNGNDGNDGMSWATAWLTLDNVNDTSKFHTGNICLFGTGTWYDSQILPPANGTEWTVYACSSWAEANPLEGKWLSKIYAGEPVADWIQYYGDIYAAAWQGDDCWGQGEKCWTLGQDDVDSLLVPKYYLSNGTKGVWRAGEFYSDTTYDSIYAWIYGGGDPDLHTMIASCKSPLFFSRGDSNVFIWGLELRYGKQGIVLWGDDSPTQNIRIEHCALSMVGNPAYENPAAVMSRRSSYGASLNTLVRACSLGWAVTAESAYASLPVPSSGTTHGGGFDIYAQKYMRIDSCYIYGPVNLGITFKMYPWDDPPFRGNVAAYNTIIDANTGLNIFNCPEDDSLYGNLIIRPRVKGIEIGGGAGNDPADWPGRLFVCNNTIYDAYQTMIYIYGADNVSSWHYPDDADTCGEWIRIKYNIGYKHRMLYTGDFDYPFFIAFSPYGPSLNCQPVCDIDSNYWYDPDSVFVSSANSASPDSLEHPFKRKGNWSTWVDTCEFDVHGFNSDPYIDTTDFSRMYAETEMIMDYGGRRWIHWGAVQPVLGPRKMWPAWRVAWRK